MRLRHPDEQPRRRQADQGLRFWMPWAYRHLMPAVAIGVAAWAVATAGNASQEARTTASDAATTAEIARSAATLSIRLQREQRVGRRQGISESCAVDEALTNAMRMILTNALSQRPRNAAHAQQIERARRLYLDIFEPLGGLVPLSEDEQDARCRARARRALTPGTTTPTITVPRKP